jgi:hypothetical protein
MCPVTKIEGQVQPTSASDIRIKDIEDIDYGVAFVKLLRPVQYRLKEGNDRIDFGFIVLKMRVNCLLLIVQPMGSGRTAVRMFCIPFYCLFNLS